jgi:hypothetical protein
MSSKNNSRMRLTISQKIELLDRYLMGRTNQLELGKWAKERFGLRDNISQQSISSIIKNCDKLYENVNVVKNGKSLKCPVILNLIKR